MGSIEALKAAGITIEKMVDAAMALYVDDKRTKESEEKIRFKLKDVILKECKDVNVESLLLAAIFLDERQHEDPVFLIADELIGINISEYIGGKKALFNFIRYDREKPGVLSELGPFLDDAIGGLIAGCMTKLFDEENESHW